MQRINYNYINFSKAQNYSFSFVIYIPIRYRVVFKITYNLQSYVEKLFIV
jgi:hypothetical protein